MSIEKGLFLGMYLAFLAPHPAPTMPDSHAVVETDQGTSGASNKVSILTDEEHGKHLPNEIRTGWSMFVGGGNERRCEASPNKPKNGSRGWIIHDVEIVPV